MQTTPHTDPMKQENAPAAGLSSAEAASHLAKGLGNAAPRTHTRSGWQIVRDNLFTFFNFLNMGLGALIVIAALSDLRLLRNGAFLLVVAINLVISIAQELRAKRTVDQLSILNAPKVRALRDGAETELRSEQLVQGDTVLLKEGDQVAVDGPVLLGEGLEIDESLLTGESVSIKKQPGDLVSAGTFVVAGTGHMEAAKVGTATGAAALAAEAKKERKKPSELLRALDRLIKGLSAVILPVGLIFLAKSWLLRSSVPLPQALVRTVSVLVGMIPEGLMLLTSVALAASVVRMGKHKMLVQRLSSIETLARIDTLCLDKTGTITTGEMDLAGAALPGGEMVAATAFPKERSPEFAEVKNAMGALLQVLPEGNATQKALAAGFEKNSGWSAVSTLPFSSARKFSAVDFGENGIWVYGAPEFIPYAADAQLVKQLSALTSKGYRVLLLAKAEAAPGGLEALSNATPKALLVIEDRVRPDAAETCRYFKEQGVALKVISGDSADTVSAIARRVGLEGAEKAVDMSTVGEQPGFLALGEQYTVFGRVTPFQKRSLLSALQGAGHIVAMTGDGVNDVLALKQADCGVAMATGSDATRATADLVLLGNDLAAMVPAVYEGRRVINNIQQVASLFLVKTIYSTLLAFFFLFWPYHYPIMPVQMTLINAMTIGIPSFILALRPNKERVQGSFIENVILRALPASLSAFLALVAVQLVRGNFALSPQDVSSLSVAVLGFCGLFVLFLVSRPHNAPKALLLVLCTAGFVLPLLLRPQFFFLQPYTLRLFMLSLPLFVLVVLGYLLFLKLGKLPALRALDRQIKSAFIKEKP